MKNVYIIGAGGHSLVVNSILSKDKTINVMGYIDKEDENVMLEKVKSETAYACLAIGDNFVRAKEFVKINQMGIKIISAIHPSAIIDTDVILGEGLVICPGAIINTCANIGDNSIINTGATIDHECKIGKNCHIAPGSHLAGNVVVGDNVLIGIGVSIIPNIKIGKNSIVAAGAVVINDVPNDSIVAGVPAKIIKSVQS